MQSDKWVISSDTGS